jgi:addiction module HigA family antidote
MRVPKYREPTHPGEMLLEEFLKSMDISQQSLSRSIRVPYQRINEIVNKRRGITPATALRLGRYFGNSAAFCMNLQLSWDLYRAQSSEAETLQKIQPLQTAH